MPYFDVNKGTLFFGKWGMFAITGTAYPASLGIDPKLIVKDAIQDVNFLAARMYMGIKYGIRGPANQCCTNPIMFMQRHH
jgi:hypothetical protein